MDTATQAYEPRNFLEGVLASIDEEVAVVSRRWPDVGQVAGHISRAGGKYSRPRLVGELGQAVGICDNRLTEVAVSAELIHVGSLLHDDVIDNASERRGVTAAHVLYGRGASILSGDVLLSRAIERLARFAPSVVGEAAATMSEVSAAALLEWSCRLKTIPDAQLWQKIATGKTGRLFEYCGASVGILLDDQEVRAGLAAATRHLGIMFQVVDDMIDFCPAEYSGKVQFTDLMEGNPSYLLTQAAAVFGPDAIRLAWQQGDSGTLSRAADQATSESVVALAQERALREFEKAQAAAQHLSRETLGKVQQWGRVLRKRCLNTAAILKKRTGFAN